MKKSRDITFYENYIYRDNYKDSSRATAASILKNLIILETDTLINFKNILLYKVIIKINTTKNLTKNLSI